MNQTQIEWTNATWNPFSGCAKVSLGCKHCYAETLAERFRSHAAFPQGFDLTLRPHKLKEPYKLKTASLIFVNSMSDLFLEEVPPSYLDQVFDVIEATPQHQYQVLTKRPATMLACSRRHRLPRNVWAGVSIENQNFAWRADLLREVDASIRFLSLEPLLGPVTLDYTGIDWCIVGGESGRHLHDENERHRRGLVEKVGKSWLPRPDRVGWVRTIRDGCLAASAKFFLKQWGGPHPKDGGRELDGRVWDEMPSTSEVTS